ncbi:MAG: type II secretion system minor pseudopilin GspI [Steroidobacteraceae bacterium]
MTAWRRHARGFTLIEVVVAMAIIVLVLAGLFFQVNRVADSSFDLRRRTLAQWVALNQLAQIRLTGIPPVGQKPAGTVQFASETWRWQAEVLQTQVQGFVEIRVSAAPESAVKDTWVSTIEGFGGNALAPAGTLPEPDWRPVPTAPATGVLPTPGGGGAPTT